MAISTLGVGSIEANRQDVIFAGDKLHLLDLHQLYHFSDTPQVTGGCFCVVRLA